MQSGKRKWLWEIDAELRKEWNYIRQNSPASSFERENPVREEERSFEKNQYQEPFQQSRGGSRLTKPYDAFPYEENTISQRGNQRPVRSSRRGFTAIDAELQKQWNHARQHISVDSFEHKMQNREREFPFEKYRYQEPSQRPKRESRPTHFYDTPPYEKDTMPKEGLQIPVRSDGQTFGKGESYYSGEEWQRRTEQALQNLGNNFDPRSGNFQGHQAAMPSRLPSMQAPLGSNTSTYGMYQSLADQLYQKPKGSSRVPVYISPKETPVNDFVKKDPLPKSNLTIEVLNEPIDHNTSASIVLRNSQEHILYCLRNRQTKLSIASPLVGNGNDLEFTTDPIVKDHLCDVLAIDIRTGAFVQLLNTVQVHSKLNDDLRIYPLDTKVHLGEKTLIVLENPQEGITYNLYDASDQLVENAHNTIEYRNKITGKELVIGDDNTIDNSYMHWETGHTNQYFLTPTINTTTDFYLRAIITSGEEVLLSNITIEL